MIDAPLVRVVVHHDVSAAAVGSVVVEIAPIIRCIVIAHVTIIVVDGGCRRKRDAIIGRRDRIVGVGRRSVRVDRCAPTRRLSIVHYVEAHAGAPACVDDWSRCGWWRS